MFKVIERTDLNQISLTGMRSIVLLGLLMVAPRTFEEIRSIFLDLKIIDKSNSNDILRIDLNTLKAMGCEICRASAKTNYKYILTKHPFSLVLSENDIKILKKVYRIVRDSANLNLLFEFDEFFKKIASHIYDEDSKEALLGVSVLKSYNTKDVKKYIEDCENKRTLNLVYKKPTEQFSTHKNIVAQKVVFKNDKIYLYGYDIDEKRTTTLNVKRIKTVISRVFNRDNLEPRGTKIKFVLKNYETEFLEEGENIVEKIDNGYIIEGNYYNEFLAMQRVLSFGPKCTVLEPLDFRNLIINKLKEMRKIYE